jgi:hypothetical protein
MLSSVSCAEYDYNSVLSAGSEQSVLSAGSMVSATSAGSILSIGSAGSILSIGSAGSILSIGSVGSILSIGSFGSALSVRSVCSILGRGDTFAIGRCRRAQPPGPPGDQRQRVHLVTTLVLAALAAGVILTS